MTTIINPWKNHLSITRDFEVGNPVYTYKDYAIYKLGNEYLYTFKNMAIGNLVGLNKQHLINVAERKGAGFLYWRAIENLKKHGLEQDNPNEYQDDLNSEA